MSITRAEIRVFIVDAAMPREAAARLDAWMAARHLRDWT
jgi:hypothetical protein